LLIDEYYEDWSKLVFVMIQGKAHLIGREEEGNEKNNHDKNNFILKEIHKLLYQKVSTIQRDWNWAVLYNNTPHKIISWKND
jgi:hypothetical protein